MDSNLTRAHVPSLDGWRFCAAMMVVVAHYAAAVFHVDPMPRTVTAVTTLSGFGMTLFFVLSGFVIHLGYHGVGVGRPGTIREFLRARAARLYPLFLVVVIADAVLAVWLRRPTVPSLLHALLHYLPLVHAWSYEILGTHSLVYQFAFQSAVTWSISVEIFFYLAYAFLLAPWFRRTAGWVRLASAAALYAATMLLLYEAQTSQLAMVTDTQDSFVRWLVYFSPYSRLMEFLTGCVAADYLLRVDARPEGDRSPVWAGPALGLLTMAVLVLMVWIYFQNTVVLGLSGSMVFAPLVGVLLYWSARYRTRMSAVLGSRLMRAGADLTYSSYLLHVFLASAFSRPLIPSGVAPWSWLAVKLTLLVILLFSIARLVFVAFEDPARRILRGRMATRDWPRVAWQSLRQRPAIVACAAVSYLLLLGVDRVLHARLPVS